MHGGGGVLRVPISSRGADTVHPCSASPPPAARQSGGRSSGKPAWDDRTVALQSPRLRRISEGDPPPQPTRRLGLGPGGLGPHLLLQELQRLRGRHRRASGGAGSITGDSSRDSMERHGPSSPLRQANRPSTVPLLGGSSRAMQRAKHAAVTEKKKKPGCSAPAGLLDCKPVQQISSSTEEQAAAAGSPGQQPAGTMGGSKGQRQLEAAATVNAAPAAGRPDENNAAARAPAGGERACGTWDKQLVQRQARGLGIYGSVDAPALAAQLSEAAVEGLVEQLCRELLLRECAPCSSMA